MSEQEMIIKNGQPMMDSRLVAGILGVEHESLIRLIDKHKEAIESIFEPLRFEIGVNKRKQGGGTPLRHVLLSEDQALSILTAIEDTAPVIETARSHARIGAMQ